MKDETMIVYVASPYRGDVARHTAYAQAVVRDAFDRGEVPIAPHLMYPGALDDHRPEQRAMGMAGACVLLEMCDLLAVYTDLGVSRGMTAEIRHAEQAGIPVEMRTLGVGDV